MTRRDPINPTDDEARALARRLIDEASFGALAVRLPGSGAPYVARVGVAPIGGAPAILVSDLALHSRALAADPACALMLGEPGDRGDPLTHPRITLVGRAEALDKAAHRDAWLAARPKSALWFEFADFRLYRIAPGEAHLNGGFGKAYRLTPADLGLDG